MNATPQTRYQCILGSPLFISTLLFLCPLASFATGAEKIAVVSGANQQTYYGSEFPSPLVVRVTDPFTQHALPNAVVHFSAGPGIKLSFTNILTDDEGLATVTATGDTVGHSTVDAEVANTPASPETRANFGLLSVHKAVLTVLPGDMAGKVGSVPTITNYTINGFVKGESLESANITGTPVLTTAATDHSPDANYAIKGGIGNLSAPNYDFVAGFGTLVLVGDGKTHTAESTSYYDADGNLSTLPSLQEAANAVRKVFLEQEFSAPIIAAKPVQAASELKVSVARSASTSPKRKVKGLELKSLDTAATPTMSGQVQQVQSVAGLNQPEAKTVAPATSTSDIRKALINPATIYSELPKTLAGSTPDGSEVSVRAASELKVQLAPEAIPTPATPATIRSAFPPPTR